MYLSSHFGSNDHYCPCSLKKSLTYSQTGYMFRNNPRELMAKCITHSELVTWSILPGLKLNILDLFFMISLTYCSKLFII